MKWAIKNNQRIIAKPKIKNAICPICYETLIPKCGTIKQWHWSHKSLKDCDAWSEPETSWHLEWKNYFPKECQEVTIGNHRADIKTKITYDLQKFEWEKDLIIELQSSPISPEDILKREAHYGNMIWLLNGERLAKNLELRGNKNYSTFRWKHPPKSWWVANKPIYIDLLNDSLFLIKKIYPNIPCGGWGKIVSKNDFIEEKNGKK